MYSQSYRKIILFIFAAFCMSGCYTQQGEDYISEKKIVLKNKNTSLRIGFWARPEASGFYLPGIYERDAWHEPYTLQIDAYICSTSDVDKTPVNLVIDNIVLHRKNEKDFLINKQPILFKLDSHEIVSLCDVKETFFVIYNCPDDLPVDFYKDTTFDISFDMSINNEESKKYSIGFKGELHKSTRYIWENNCF